MRIYFDTEFIEDGRTIDLISIGMVKDTGEEYYAVSTEFDGSKASNWVKEHVFKYMPWPRPIERYSPEIGMQLWIDQTEENRPWRNRQQIAQDIVSFVGTDKPEFWGYYSSYDWIALCQLYGTMLQLPQGWPRYCRDVKQYADMLGGIRLPNKPDKEHHALEDARWTGECWEFLQDTKGIARFTFSNSWR